MACGLSNGHVTDDVTWPPKVLWGSTVGYPSDSLASCTWCLWLWIGYACAGTATVGIIRSLVIVIIGLLVDVAYYCAAATVYRWTSQACEWPSQSKAKDIDNNTALMGGAYQWLYALVMQANDPLRKFDPYLLAWPSTKTLSAPGAWASPFNHWPKTCPLDLWGSAADPQVSPSCARYIEAHCKL